MKRFLFTLPLAFLLTGCVETLLTFRLLPSGECRATIISRGDSTDIFNEDFLHPPDGGIWRRSLTKDMQDKDSIWVMTSEGFSAVSPLQLPGDDRIGLLRYPLSFTREAGWFTTTYSMSQTFAGREIYRKSPLLGKAIIEHTVNDSTRWKPEAWRYIIGASLNRLDRDSTLSLPPGLTDKLRTHFSNYFAHVNEASLFSELETAKPDLIRKILTPFAAELPDGFLFRFLDAMAPFEREIYLSARLEDDQFLVAFILPGKLRETNADSLADDTLFWKFGVEKFLGDDYELHARSLAISATRFQKLVVGVVLGIVLLIIGIWVIRR